MSLENKKNEENSKPQGAIEGIGRRSGWSVESSRHLGNLQLFAGEKDRNGQSSQNRLVHQGVKKTTMQFIEIPFVPIRMRLWSFKWAYSHLWEKYRSRRRARTGFNVRPAVADPVPEVRDWIIPGLQSVDTWLEYKDCPQVTWSVFKPSSDQTYKELVKEGIIDLRRVAPYILVFLMITVSKCLHPPSIRCNRSAAHWTQSIC